MHGYNYSCIAVQSKFRSTLKTSDSLERRASARLGARRLLMLRDCRVDKSHRKLDYNIMPFKVDGFEKGKFVPLVLYAAPWWDENYEICRFCGKNELSPDMTSELLKDSPHYFVIGVKFE